MRPTRATACTILASKRPHVSRCRQVTKAPQPPSLTVEYREEADSSVPCEGLRRATHQRYLNSVGRASSSQTMIVSGHFQCCYFYTLQRMIEEYVKH